MTPKKVLRFEQYQTATNNNPTEIDLLQQRTTITELPPILSRTQRSEDCDVNLCTENEGHLNFFDGLTVYIYEHYDDLHAKLKAGCENAGAKLVNKKYRKEVNYVIIPFETSTDVDSIPVKGKNVVNNLWIKDAVRENKLVEKKYYHGPIPSTADKKPLEGIMFVISLYSCNSERLFIESLAIVLGAKKSDVYAREERLLLMCPSPEGAKYNAALKWGFPVVSSEWLLECARLGTKVGMSSYLVGEAVAKDEFLETSTSGSPSGTTRDKDYSKLSGATLIEQIEIPARRSGSAVSSLQSTPDRSPFNTSDFMQEVTTPLRDILYEVLKEAESKKTLPLQRLKNLVATPKTKPQVRKRLGFHFKYYRPNDKNNDRRQSTPLSELKRRLWKESIAENYTEYVNIQSNGQTQVFDLTQSDSD